MPAAAYGLGLRTTAKGRTNLALGESFPGVLLATRGRAEWAWTLIYRDLAPLVMGYLRSRGAREPEDPCSAEIGRAHV